MYLPRYDKDRGWRIVYVGAGGETRDICGAINEMVAIEQCAILNRMRR